VNDKVPQALLVHPKTEIHVFATVEVNLVKTSKLKEGIAATCATGRSYRAPFSNLALKGTMQETLPVMPWIALGGKNDSHVVVSSVAV
jgi:hypothetical protein